MVRARRWRDPRIGFRKSFLVARAQPPPRLGTLRGIRCGCRDRRLRAQCFARFNIELTGDRQPVAYLITRQCRSQLAAVCAVHLAGVKTARSQFHLHRAHVVVRRNCFDECKADCDTQKNRTPGHINVSNADPRLLLHGLKARLAKRARELAPSRIDCHHQRSRHRRAAAPCPSPLAHAHLARAS